MALGEHLRILIGGRFDHAVDCGDRTVLHLAFTEERGRPAVKRSLLQDFTSGAERVEVLRAGVRTYPPKMVVSRAFSKLGDSNAWAMFPTPEHFVAWCLTGQPPVLPPEAGAAPAAPVAAEPAPGTALARVPRALPPAEEKVAPRAPRPAARKKAPPAKAAPKKAKAKARPAKRAKPAAKARPAKRAKPAAKPKPAKKAARKAPKKGARKAPAKKSAGKRRR